MAYTKAEAIAEIEQAFSFDRETAETCVLLLDARAQALDYSFSEYMERYHPDGIASRDDNLPEQFDGYVQFLGDDARAIMGAGKSAGFMTFVHEAAHVFRRQLTGELREQAEKAFGIENGEWTEGKEEDFARGLERFIEKRRHKNELKREVYRKGGQFVDTVYRGMEHIIAIDPRMETVYEKLFEENSYRFNREKFAEILQQVSEGKMPETSHVYLGMTPCVYEELGFERLPMAITRKHLYSTMRESSIFENVHYHNLGEDIFRQIPESLKNPLAIVQSNTHAEDIISIVELKDKNGNPVIIPITQYQKGHFNDAEIDINLVKTIFGKDGFENWMMNAVRENRLLYADKKKTGWALDENLITLSRAPSIPASNHMNYHHQDVSGFYTENIARYREAVNQKFPDRFLKPGKRLLYQKHSGAGQLGFDFGPETKTPHVPEAAHVPAVEKPAHEITPPLPNNALNFHHNFPRVAGSFPSDRIEAARRLLRRMSGEDRAVILETFSENGLDTPEKIRGYLAGLLDRHEEWKQQTTAALAHASAGTGQTETMNAPPENYRPFGAWTDFGQRLSERERQEYNTRALEVLNTVREYPVTEDEKKIAPPLLRLWRHCRRR